MDQGCLDDDTITALLERRLPASEMQGVDAHLDVCASCRALVATLADDVSCARMSEIPEVLEETRIDDEEIPPAVSARIGSVLKDKWTLEAVLGVGGMAAVYKGRHRIGRVDAIKIVHRELAQDAEVCARFEREARAVNRLNHRGAAAIRDIDTTEDGAPFMVMEFLDGESLSVAAQSGIATDRLLNIASEILDVLADAHSLGVIHRDIKPANIFLTSDGSCKLLDFGLARLRGLGQRSVYTQAGQTLGTLAYMPPEQLRGEGVDHRSDVFSVGATMFRVLSGRHVHVGRNTAETLTRIATEPAPSLADVAREIPLPVCKVVDRALAFEPGDRYPDAETMRTDVLALMSGDDPSYATSWTSDEEEDSDAASLALVGKTVGAYLLDGLIARGGMGAVYRASRDGQAVAVKVILGDMLDRGGDARARFRREIRAASRIDSPHVVQVLDAGIDDASGLPFYAMEFLEGRDLEQWLVDVGPLEPDAVARIFLQACRGVRAAFDMGIVHRDIKPANIMLTPDDHGELVVKLCDFGLAKTHVGEEGDKSQSLTQSGGILGTPRYSAPEQATRAKEVDVRADIWGLSISMHEALCGRKPWAGCETLGQLIVAICTQDMPSIRDVAPWVDPQFVTLVEGGLVRDAEQRTQTLAEVESQLLALAGDGRLTTEMMRQVDAASAISHTGVADNSEDVTVARSIESSAPGPARRSRALPFALVGLAAAGAIGVAAWSAGPSRADSVEAPAVALDGSTTPMPKNSTASPAASAPPKSVPTASVTVPPPAASSSAPAVRPRTPGPRAAPLPRASSRPSKPPKPGGLDFRKTW